ncbi:MAG: CoA transferase [Chloroflexota bacterium]
MEKALQGVRVVDFTHNQAGPSCTQMLAWMGADVIKVENPQGGDEVRTSLVFNEFKSSGLDSFFFLLLNGNKRSITLNLRSKKGQEICKEIIRQSDVVVQNYGLGTMERLGLGWNVLKELNPRLIYASINGYGTYGPYSSYKCFESIAQATSGAMSMTGYPENPPTLSAPCVGDSGTGMHMVIGILGAILQREKTGRGQMVEVAMQEATLNLLRTKFSPQYDSGETINRPGEGARNSRDLNLARVYPCKGGGPNDYVFINLNRDISQKSPSNWEGLLKTIEREDLLSDENLADRAYRAKHRDEIVALITGWTKQHDKYEVMHRMNKNGVACGATLDSKEVLSDPHLRARGMITTVEQHKRGPVDMIGCPIQWGDAPVEISAAPLLGQHTDEILAQFLGYDSTQAKELKTEGVV